MDETKPEAASFSWRNFFSDTPANVLFLALLIEGTIAIVLSAGWADESSIWWARMLPLVQFAVGQFKLFFKTRLEALTRGKTFTVSTSDPGATVTEETIHPDGGN